MTHCYDDGVLHAYLDEELPPGERDTVETHVAACVACRERLEELQRHSRKVLALLSPPQGATPDPLAALARYRRQVGASGHDRSRDVQLVSQYWWRNLMLKINHIGSSRQRRYASGLLAAALAIGLLLFPPVRALADQMLQLFRVQSVVFVPTSRERMEQLDQLNFDEETLFVARPEIVNNPAPPKTVGSLADAQGMLGFRALEPSTFPTPPTATELTVRDRTVGQFQVNVQAARQLLSLMDIRDVTIPDALGSSPIVADMAPTLEARYTGANYEIRLIQGTSPTVTLPEGVDLAQLGKAALRLLGMDEQQAESLSRSVNWSSTLIFPFPTDLSNVRQVTIGDASGLLIGDDDGGSPHTQLYWQRGDRFFVMEGRGRGLHQAEALAAAESLR